MLNISTIMPKKICKYICQSKRTVQTVCGVVLLHAVTAFFYRTYCIWFQDLRDMAENTKNGSINRHFYMYALLLTISHYYHTNYGSELLTLVAMKSNIFWDIILYRSEKVNHCFGGTYHSHLLHRREGQARNQNKTSSKQNRIAG
jgi:hypothetical protein